MANPSGRESDPLIAYKFRIEIDGPVEVTGYFTECSGLGSEHEVVDHQVTNPDTGEAIIQKIPGRLKWEDVVLKRGITNDMGIWDWRQKVIAGKMQDDARANCSIIMMDVDGSDVARWDLVNAWPSKVSGPAPKSDSNEFGVEEMTIVHEGLVRAS